VGVRRVANTGIGFLFFGRDVTIIQKLIWCLVEAGKKNGGGRGSLQRGDARDERNLKDVPTDGNEERDVRKDPYSM